MADQFELEYETITGGQRSPKWVQGHKDRLRLHLRPFFGKMDIAAVNASTAQDYRVHRANQVGRVPPKPKDGQEPVKPKPPSRSTIHDEIGTLSLVLQTALRHGKIDRLPNLSPPYKMQGKIVHRPWFSPAEYKALYTATRNHKNAATGKARWSAEQLHDFVLFMGNTGLRPDEASNLQHRDVSVVTDDATGQRILEIEVRGKRGIGYCKSMPGAVVPYERLRDRPKLQPYKRLKVGEVAAPPELPAAEEPLFPADQVKVFNRVLDKAKLKYDRDGLPRTAYSLRHTYICLRLMEGADCRAACKRYPLAG